MRLPGDGALWALLVSGLLGFRIGMAGYPTWSVAVETAQVVAGIVQYPADSPFYIYHTKLWTVLHQIGALALLSGMSEIAVSKLLSGLLGMVSFQALTMIVYALSRDVLLAIGAAFVIVFTRAAEYGVVYPIFLMGTHHTYGALGLSLIALIAALFGSGCHRTAAFLLGVAPAVHPSLGAALGLAVAAAFVSRFRSCLERFRPAMPYFVAGAATTAVSLAVQLMVTYDAPPIEPGVAARYMEAFVTGWDGHRRAVALGAPGVRLNAGALVLGILYLAGAAGQLERSAEFLLRIITAAALLSLAAVLLSWVPPDRLPPTLLIVMPARVLNFNALLFATLLIGLLGAYRRRVSSQLFIGMLMAGLLISDRSASWDWLQARGWGGFGARPGQLLLFAIAAGGLVGLVITRRAGAAREGGAWPAAQAARVVWLVPAALAAAAMVSRTVPAAEVYRDRTNDPFFAAVAAETTGMVLTAGSFQLVQLYTRRPVLIDGGGLDALPYALEAGPLMERVLRDVYDIDLFHPPMWAKGSGFIPHEANQPVWEGFSRERWLEIRHTYHATQVLTRANWRLDLPVAAESPSFRLYRIPD